MISLKPRPRRIFRAACSMGMNRGRLSGAPAGGNRGGDVLIAVEAGDLFNQIGFEFHVGPIGRALDQPLALSLAHRLEMQALERGFDEIRIASSLRAAPRRGRGSRLIWTGAIGSG